MAGTEADLTPLAGLRFRCIPGCGLCCFTSPAISATERARLIQIDPEVPMLGRSTGWSQVASRPDGGACYFLDADRCRCHPSRPATCSEFPLSVHVGRRTQIAAVLGCPGVDISGLGAWADGIPAHPPDATFRVEIESACTEIDRAGSDGRIRRAGQIWGGLELRLRRTGLWEPEERVRAEVGRGLSQLVPTELPELNPDEEGDDLAALPLFYDPNLGRVAWRSHTAGIEFVTLRATGGVDRHLGVLAAPRRSPEIDADGTRLIRGYLRYVLERDHLLGYVYAVALEGGSATPSDLVRAELVETAAEVIRMGALRRALDSDRDGPLTTWDVERGIRATDMDRLDRPTAGLRL